jgi:hypothetical protein
VPCYRSGARGAIRKIKNKLILGYLGVALILPLGGYGGIKVIDEFLGEHEKLVQETTF